MRDRNSLFQQYIVDCYAVIDQQTFDFLRRNQKTIRADLYQGVQNALFAGDHTPETLGQRVILPSSFTRRDRAMALHNDDCESELA